MPWSAADYPSSMKNLDPHVRRKAIEIANAIVADGGDEGTAIATAITRAREHFEKKGTARHDARRLAGDVVPQTQSAEEPTGGHAFSATAAEAPTAEPTALESSDPEDPTVHIVGFGVMRRSQIEKGVPDRLEDIVRRGRAGDWANAIFLFKNGVPGAMMDALDHHRRTGIWWDVEEHRYKKLQMPPASV